MTLVKNTIASFLILSVITGCSASRHAIIAGDSELTDAQFPELYYDSPHKQIKESFRCEVIKVIDGDTIKVRVDWRDFDFPVRVLEINAP
ncbi:hypothetical protein LCGC14_1702960, partial [marine sediment metagenome]